MTDDTIPPLGPITYLPPRYVCLDHQGDRYADAPCVNCRPLTADEAAEYRAAFFATHPTARDRQEDGQP